MTGTFLDYLFVFWGGLLISLTPCVYPVLPLLVASIAGANIKGNKTTAFILSLVYVLGLALTYSALAVLAVLSGRLFGSFQNSHWVFLFVANALMFFALVMLDVIPLKTLTIGHARKEKPRNLWSVFFMGISSGMVVGPCTAPALGFLFVYIGVEGQLVRGIILTLVFSFGMGTPLILIGTFSGLLAALPKAGLWMVWIKRVCGVILLLAAEIYLFKAGTLFFN